MLLKKVIVGFTPESAQDSPVQIDSVTFQQGAVLSDVDSIPNMQYLADWDGTMCVMYEQTYGQKVTATFMRPDTTQYSIIGGHPIHRPRPI